MFAKSPMPMVVHARGIVRSGKTRRGGQAAATIRGCTHVAVRTEVNRDTVVRYQDIIYDRVNVTAGLAD